MVATFWSQIPRGLFETSRLRVSNHVLVDNLDRYTSWKGPNQVRRQPPTASQCWVNMTIWLEVCVRFEKSKSAIDNLIADCEGSQWDTSFAHVLVCRGWTIRPVREMEPQNRDRLQIINIVATQTCGRICLLQFLQHLDWYLLAKEMSTHTKQHHGYSFLVVWCALHLIKCMSQRALWHSTHTRTQILEIPKKW